MRIVVDTNVLVSAFVSATSSPARILDLWRAGDLEIVTSQAALDELQRVLLYPRIRTRLRYSDDQIDQFVTLLRKHALYLAEVPPLTGIAPDPDDDKFLALAQSGAADIIVTGDADLLALHPFHGVEIISPREFLDRSTKSLERRRE